MPAVATRSLAQSAAPPAASPAVLGDWELLAVAARGEFATVYRARPRGRRDAANYAVKVARTDRRDAESCAALVKREADVAARLSHPNLTAVLAAELADSPVHLAMPWLEGATLAARLAAGQQFALPVVLAIARQAAQALTALAELGFRHGDVKPSNVMVSPTGHATLIDLGFSCHEDDEPADSARHWLGTPLYAAPERFTSRLRVTPQSDVYSLGVMLFQLLSGRPPFQTRSVDESAAAHVHGRAPSLSSLRPELPNEISRLTAALLAKEPLRRPTARELVDEFARWEIAYLTRRGDNYSQHAADDLRQRSNFQVRPAPSQYDSIEVDVEGPSCESS